MARLAVGGVWLEDNRGALPMPRGDMAVERVVAEVEDAVLIPFDAHRIERPVGDGRRRRHPVEPLRLFGPEGVGIGAALRIEPVVIRSEEHTSELQSLMRISYAVFCLKKKTNTQ